MNRNLGSTMGRRAQVGRQSLKYEFKRLKRSGSGERTLLNGLQLREKPEFGFFCLGKEGRGEGIKEILEGKCVFIVMQCLSVSLVQRAHSSARAERCYAEGTLSSGAAKSRLNSGSFFLAHGKGLMSQDTIRIIPSPRRQRNGKGRRETWKRADAL